MYLSGFKLAAVVIGAIFLLGWIWPLIAGIIRAKRGNSGVALIVVGSVWGIISILMMVFAGLCVFMAFKVSESYNQKVFTLDEYDGPTSTLVSTYKGEAELTASSSHDGGHYTFASSNGAFTVPAAKITPKSYAITASGENDTTWHANWGFYSNPKTFDLDNNSSMELTIGPPLTAKVTRREMSEGRQELNLEFTDSEGTTISLRSHIAPSIEILDDTGAVVWTHKLEYG